jgi:murein DD-endopeptidase MepM/ murein hydrolase activator NlpD
VDYGLPSYTRVIAPHNGVVVEAGWSAGGYGYYVKIQNGVEGSVLAHLSRIDVYPGQWVNEGQNVALSDNTGNSTGPHLHWGYYRLPRNRANGYDGFIFQGPYITDFRTGGGADEGEDRLEDEKAENETFQVKDEDLEKLPELPPELPEDLTPVDEYKLPTKTENASDYED